ncbi:MAG: M4 family metallopeptidase [Bacteroidales bacterium]|nr:M4 family metallopeptidase [Bacteroidales bacterium]
MKIKFFYIGVIFISIFFLQSFHSDEKESDLIIDQSKSLPQHGWYFFEKTAKVDPKNVFENYKDIFGLSSNDQMKLFKESKSEIPNEVFYRFQQYYKGIKIVGAVMLVKSNNDILELVHGKITKNLNINAVPAITEQEALNNALKEINAPEYAWENESWELQRKIEENSSLATWYPKAELQIVALPGFNNFNQAEFCLIYKFDIQVSSSNTNYTVEVNAYNGEIIRCHPKILSANGTVETVYNGSKSVTTYYRGFPYWDFILEDRSRTNKIDTREYATTDWPCALINFWNLPKIDGHDNYWSLGEDNNAASAHWAVSKTYEFYATQLYRTTGIREVSGYDIRVQNRYYPRPWDDQATTCFGWGGGGDYINVGYLLGQNGFEGGLDIIAHEFTHGVGVFSAGLDEVYDKPAGPLTESFCDILGESVEYYVNGNCDYIMGTNLANQFKRCFYNPNLYRPYTYTLYYGQNACSPTSYTTQLDGYYPTTYSELIPGYNGNIAHKNSAIQNRWFYLLANGDPLLGVQGIGITKAYKIAYRTLIYHISGVYDDYFDSRLGSIQSASELYGECSNEYKQVMNAWAAVGVGTPAPDPCLIPLVVDIDGPSSVNCGTGYYFYSDVQGGNGNYSYEWSVNFTVVSYSQNLYYYFPGDYFGYCYIRLEVTDGEQTENAYLYPYVNCNSKSSSSGELSLSIYPNPASDILTLQINEEYSIIKNESIVTIYDKYGKKLYSINTKDTELQINISTYFPGNYYITVLKNDKQYTIGFIKK